MEKILLKVEIREKSSKKDLSEFRTKHLIPAVVYGGSKGPLAVIVGEKELSKATKEGGANAVLHLKHSKGEDTVILKQLQRHVVTHQPIHADFQRISLKQKIEVKVPLHVVGEAPGVKLHGGILEHVLREFRVRGLPTALPQRIDVDVSRLDINQSILVRDVPIPEGVEILEAADHLVINVVQPTAEVVAPAPEAVAAGETEPEVIAKGKKEEEGEEGAKGEKPKAGAPTAKAAPAAATGAEKKKEGGK